MNLTFSQGQSLLFNIQEGLILGFHLDLTYMMDQESPTLIITTICDYHVPLKGYTFGLNCP